MCFIIMWADQRKLLEPEIGHFELQKNQKSRSQNPSITRTKALDQGEIGKFRRPISELNHILDAKNVFHNYVGRSAEASRSEIGHFEFQKNQKSRSQNPSITRTKHWTKGKSGNF